MSGSRLTPQAFVAKWRGVELSERPAWLDHAHRALDRAVLDAYGWPHDLEDDDLLARLLALNAVRASATRGATPAPAGVEE